MGASLLNDVLGPVQTTRVGADFAYTLKLLGSRKLTFGANVAGSILNVQSSSLNTTVEGDPAFIDMVNNRVVPNFGFGMIYRSNNWITGVSLPRLLENSYKGTSPTTLEKRHLYLLGGKLFDISQAFKLRSMAQLKLIPGAPVGLDLSTTMILYNTLYVGVLYRLDASFGGFVQYRIGDAFRVGLGTEYSTQDIRGYNFGTFELMLSYDFFNGSNVVRKPRYF